MKALRVVLPLVVAGVVVLVAVAQLRARSASDAYLIERAALRREMVERSIVARGVGSGPGVEEAKAVLRWWLQSNAALRARFPGASRDADAASAKAAGGAEGETWRRYAATRIDLIRSGYSPVLSATDQGVRLDVLAIAPGEHPDTHERALRIDFAVWGAPRRLDREGPAETARGPLRVVIPLAFRQIAFRFVTAAGKPYGEMTGSGEPWLVLKDPERFSSELPPAVAFGTWWVDLFPRDASKVELTVGLQVSGMSSASLTPSFRWELAAAEEWKLRPGEAYRAEQREAPPEPAPAR